MIEGHGLSPRSGSQECRSASAGKLAPGFHLLPVLGGSANLLAVIAATAFLLVVLCGPTLLLVIEGVVAADSPYAETFDGQPASPQPGLPHGWDVTVHSRDPGTWLAQEPMLSHHGADCSPPLATHAIRTYEDAVFVCHDHLMTAINASGYGVIYLTPDHLLDFSAGEAVVQFDLSTLRSSPRNWIDLWISPYEQHLQLPLEDWLPDLNGPPANAVHVKMESLNGTTPFKALVYRNWVEEDLGGDWQTGYESFLTPSATRRDTFELRLSRTHLRFGMPAYDFWWIDADIADLGWDQGVVQFGHHSYDPTRNCPSCGPNTWHWDNVRIEPAVPFTMLRADRRYVDAETAPEMRFPAPAPESAHLRFAGVGAGLQVSFDGGARWEAARVQRQRTYDATRFQSYWMPIPAGTSGVWFRSDTDSAQPWMVQDVSIWALQTPGG
jgi:hypothetical protein